MNRLLQGDVGSGKTVIAATAAILAAKNGQQTAILAPTEVLAQQHYRTITNLFKEYFSASGRSPEGREKEIEILTGGSKGKKSLNEKIESGEIKIIIGTHAIIQKTVKFKNLALVIVDEQHRFGVEQRAALLKNKEISGHPRSQIFGPAFRTSDVKNSPFTIPHLLSMSATPIPRTLALTIFGDLDLSIINELPAGRKPIITKVVAPTNREKAYVLLENKF